MYHKDLEAWKKSVDLVTSIYSETQCFPDDEKFGLTNQIRRAAVSIPSNLAEGCARATDRELLRFIDISLGSLAELETQLIISEKLGYLKNKELYSDINTVSALISGLKKYINKK